MANFYKIFLRLLWNMSAALAWSVESLPTNKAVVVQFPSGLGVLISMMGLGVCPLYVLSYVVFWRWLLHFAAQRSRRPFHMLLFRVLVHSLASPTGIWSMGIWIVSPILGEVWFPAGSDIFYLCFGTESVSFVYILPRVVSGGDMTFRRSSALV